MFVNSQNWEDATKYFKDCYVKFKETGDEIFFVETVSPSLLVACNRAGEEVGLDLNNGYTLDYVIPKKTIYQWGEQATMLSRIPARMWKKGINKANTRFEVLRYNGTWQPSGFDFNTLEAFVNKPCYTTFADFEKSVRNGGPMESAAISPRVSASRDGSVFIDSVKVGQFYPDKKLLKLKAIFYPELKPLFDIYTLTKV